jgi:CDGSH-type Zn-finger protein
MIEMGKKGLTNEKIDAIIAKVNMEMRKNITERTQRYHSVTCKCGHSWAMDKPATLENKAKPSRVLRIHRDEAGEIIWVETVRKAGQCWCGRSLNYPKIRFDCNDEKGVSIPSSIQPHGSQLNYVKVDMDGMASIDNMIEANEGVE